MKKFICMICFLLTVCHCVSVDEKKNSNPQVVMETSKGTIVLELFTDKAPLTVANFIMYANEGFYNGTIFHRVIKKFMIQGGGFTKDMKQRPAGKTIKNEADNGLKNDRGTIAMARKPSPHSATAHFFINTVDNDSLNHKDKSPKGWGYAVFGRVIDGMDVVDTISASKTEKKGRYRDVPVDNIILKKVYRKD